MDPKRIACSVFGAVLAAAALVLAAAPAQARTFSGFDDQFNLGRSAQSGAVCEADRDFDDPLVGDHARAWSVTCRGWSQPLGRIYVFDRSRGGEPPPAWRASVAKRADCDFSQASAVPDLKSGKTVTCKSLAAGLAYLTMTDRAGRRVIAAEGMAAVGDVLVTGVKYVSGSIREPAAVAEQTASVTKVASDVSALSAGEAAAKLSVEGQREVAYRSNQQWQFDDAQAIFAELANGSGAGSNSSAIRAEALYNLALNVSNEGRFDEANIYFDQADALVRQDNLGGVLAGLALNYRAAHARNQYRFEDAIKLADEAVAARRSTITEGAVVKEDSGAIRINDGGGATAGARLTPAQRDELRDVQALQIKATSLEQLGRTDEARQALQQAATLLDQPLSASPGQTQHLSDGSPWLNTRVRADILRLDRNVGRAAQSTPQLRLAIDAFALKYPDSMPLAGFLVELARAEAAAREDDKALADYETAFDIFRRQRGALGASADQVGTYFDILLARIGDAPAQHGQDVARFFAASQSLLAQQSADVAKKQAARIMSGNSAAAGLARAVDETEHSIRAKIAEQADMRQRGLDQGEAKTKVETELRALNEQYKTLEQQLLQADPRYASVQRSLVGLDELQKTLRPGEAYVKVFMLANRGYGMLVTNSSARPYAVELSRDKAQALVDALRRPIDQLKEKPVLGRYDVALAHDAFIKLFGPVQSDLLAAKLIVYEPDSTLIGAPLGALVVDEASVGVMRANLERAKKTKTPLSYAGVAWLAAKIPSAVALSPAAFVQARAAAASKAPDPFYGFGDPEISQDPRAFTRVKAALLLDQGSADYCGKLRQALYRLEPLPQTADEVKAVAASLGQGPSDYSLGPSFTDTGVLSLGSRPDGLARYRVVYFATHGILPDRNGCLQPALVTSLGDGQSDGLIDVNQIPQLNLDADMVVLSACDTGRANGNGGDVGGLVSTFVEAGTRNVVVSNWSVDSVATERLMASMFAAKGVSQAEALGEAEQAMLSSPDQYSHPFYWASFTVIGDGARPMPGG